jgi:hypothetical protein
MAGPPSLAIVADGYAPGAVRACVERWIAIARPQGEQGAF